jgi:translation initiation factor 5B
VQADLTDILKKVQKKGVCVQASTLGSLEALLTFLGESNIPVGSINIGPVHRADVIKASVNLDKGKRKEFGCILAFDVPVDKDAKAEAAKAGVRIFTADIIYHLFDQFTAYLNELKAKEKAEAALKVVFPCILEIVPGCVFNKKDPIVIGVRVVEGLLKLGTPLCVQKIVTTTDDEGRTRNRKEMLYIGKITSLQVPTALPCSPSTRYVVRARQFMNSPLAARTRQRRRQQDNHKEVPQAVVDQQVAIKIEGGSVTFGRQLDESSKIYSQLSRESIDALKDHFRDVLVANKGMVALIQKLKPMFDIM